MAKGSPTGGPPASASRDTCRARGRSPASRAARVQEKAMLMAASAALASRQQRGYESDENMSSDTYPSDHMDPHNPDYSD